MTVLLLGSQFDQNEWQVLHEAESYKAMAKELDLHLDRSKYNSFAVISSKYFDSNSKTIKNPEEAFSKTPAYVEKAFCKALGME